MLFLYLDSLDRYFNIDSIIHWNNVFTTVLEANDCLQLFDVAIDKSPTDLFYLQGSHTYRPVGKTIERAIEFHSFSVAKEFFCNGKRNSLF